MKIFSVLKNRLISPVKTMFKEFGNRQFKLGVTRFLSAVFKDSGIGNHFGKKVQSIIISQLEQEFSYVLNKYKDYRGDCEYDEQSPVWVSWMQGFDNAPDVVKKCIESIKNSTKHPVNIVTEDNLMSFYDFPEYIMQKYRKGIISKAQFSDILRMTLLSEYGGLWIDATIFIPEKLPEEIFEYEFYTCKRKPVVSGYVSNYMWTSFLNGCQKNCVVQKVNRELFYEYWKKNNYLIDYLLVDYFMMIVYRNIPYAKQLIDNVPYNNSKIEELQSRMSLPFNQKDYDELIHNGDTSLFKLSWRMPFDKTTKSGEKTYFGKFIE